MKIKSSHFFGYHVHFHSHADKKLKRFVNKINVISYIPILSIYTGYIKRKMSYEPEYANCYASLRARSYVEMSCLGLPLLLPFDISFTVHRVCMKRKNEITETELAEWVNDTPNGSFHHRTDRKGYVWTTMVPPAAEQEETEAAS